MAGRRKEIERNELAQGLLDISRSFSESAQQLQRLVTDAVGTGTSTSSGEEDQFFASRELLRRAKNLGRKQRTQRLKAFRDPQHATVANPSSIWISVSTMKEGKQGSYSRNSAYVEIEADRGDSYDELLQRAATTFKLLPRANKLLTLFRGNGVAVIDQMLQVRSKKVPWTLGNYLQVTKRSPAQTKLGVGYLPKTTFGNTDPSESPPPSGNPPPDSPSTSTESGKEGSTPTSRKGRRQTSGPLQSSKQRKVVRAQSGYELRVTYEKDTPGVGMFVEKEMERQEVWVAEGGNPTEMDKSVVFYPETRGYQVVRIVSGTNTLLQPVMKHTQVVDYNVAGVDSKDTQVFVASQSPSTVTVKSLLSPIPLYCVSSEHATTIYKWHKLGQPQFTFPPTPVVYVAEVGLYKCEMTDHLNDVTMESSVVAVEVEPGPVPPPLFCSEGYDHLPQTLNKPLEGAKPDAVINLTDPSSKSSTAANGCGDGGGGSGLRISYSDLRKATNDFADTNVVGVGGFGRVYRGYMSSTTVAIKVLSERGSKAIVPKHMSETLQDQMTNELRALTKYRHRNLVELMGFCTQPAILVYEFMEKGSLFQNLHCEGQQTLTWQQRSTVLKDACRGLAWLHGSRPPLVHQDIKSANVLLDSSFHAKLGDFGFSIEMPDIVDGRSQVTAPGFYRTEGYYPAELSEGLYSTKSDVYSYGVVVLETYCGLKAYDKKRREDKKLTELMQEKLITVELFGSIVDEKAGVCAPYLRNLFYKIVSASLAKHSKRVYISKVMELWNETNF